MFSGGLVAVDRSFTVVVTGEPNEFKVSFGIGKWIQNLGVGVLETVPFDFLLMLFVEAPASF